jgi:hypothetical protein
VYQHHKHFTTCDLNSFGPYDYWHFLATNTDTRTSDLWVGIGLDQSYTVRDVLYINRPRLFDRNIGASILVGPSTTDMNANTAITTIADTNSGRYEAGTDGIAA